MGDMIIRSKKIITSQDILDGYIVIRDGKILDICEKLSPDYESASGVIDAAADYVSAGFIDMHTHGGGGADFMDQTVESFLIAAKMHMRHGTTSIVPTAVTASIPSLRHTISVFNQARKIRGDNPHLPGLHLEGPYLSREQCGAQDPRYIIQPDEDEYTEIVRLADGAVIRWSVAPELDGAMKMGDYLRDCGILASIAHSNAEFETVRRAFSHGYSLLTHFYSAMSTIVRKNGFRRLGVVESGYIIDDMDVEIIADGCHLPPDLLYMIYKLKGPDRVALVTDSMRGAGLPEGPSVLGGLADGMDVIVEDGVAKLPDRSAFAGSVATADRLVRVMHREAGVGIRDAVKMITKTPARILGLQKKKGDIQCGMDADIVIFDEDICIKTVIVDGRVVSEAF